MEKIVNDQTEIITLKSFLDTGIYWFY